MAADIAKGIGAAIAVALAAAAVWFSQRTSSASACGAEGKYVLDRALAVVPSVYGDGNDPLSQVWLRGGWTPASLGTSCGVFEAYVLEGRVNTRNGTGQVQTEAERLGVWHNYVPGGPLPCQGDAYVLVKPGANHVAAEAVHVGTWDHVDSDGVTAHTVDGGQGGHDSSQGAAEVTRLLDQATGLISHLGVTLELSGWLAVNELGNS